MKKLNQPLVLLCFCLCIHFLSSAQSDLNGVTVRLNHKLLDFSKINDQKLTSGSISTFLNNEGKKLMQENQFHFLENLTFTKIFSNLTTSDSIYISRTGEVVYMPPFWATFHVPSNPQNNSKFIKKLQGAYPIVIYAHPNYTVEYLSTPNDSLFHLQHAFSSLTYPNGHINVEDAWETETGKRFIKVGVFDTGIDTTHPDLKSQILTGRGYNFNLDSLSDWGTDNARLHGHGTAIAGLIGAKRNNTTGVAGIAGGDGSDSTGVSLIDFRIFPNSTAETKARAVVDAARSVGSYWDWSGANPQPETEEYYWSHAAGFGIHIGNHSYRINLANVVQIDTTESGKDFSDSTDIDDILDPPPVDCFLCREAFLFSLQNGVVNVVSSGNGLFPVAHSGELYCASNIFPQNYDDTWIIDVGGTGTDGNWFDGTNGITQESYNFARASTKMDVAAPFTHALNYSTASRFAEDTVSTYATFNGTSFSAPNVAGVVALLLSHYNQNCYSASNLDPADIEYILEHSARDVNNVGYDHFTGHGLVDASAALNMIDFPEYQIIHPELNPVSVSETAVDTITLFLNEPLDERANGPIAGDFPLLLERYYDVERYEYDLTYDFLDYVLPSTQVLDYWSRPSATNSLGLINDTA